MPELPEIEVLRETIATRHLGQTVVGIRLRQIALLKTYDPPLDGLVGHPLTGARRYGKHILLEFSEQVVAAHLGIGGRIVPVEPRGAHPGGRALSLTVEWDDGSNLDVVELGTKKRSSVHVLRSDSVVTHLAKLGPDALGDELTIAALHACLQAASVQLKGMLTHQHVIAGIGNAYSDEILWDAYLSPLRLTSSLADDEIERLHTSIGSVLRAAIERARGDNYLTVPKGDKRGSFQVHRRDGQPCSRCSEPIASIHFADRSLQYCPGCQTDGRHYADRRLSRLLK